MKEVLISGLSIIFSNPKVDDEVKQVLGPALYTAIGSKIFSEARPGLLTTISQDYFSSYCQLLNILDIGNEFISTTSRSQMQWISKNVMSFYGLGTLTDNPLHWSYQTDKTLPNNLPLFFSNGDPLLLNYLLDKINPCFLSLDLYHQWIGFRKAEIESLLYRTDIICGTEKEFSMLSKSVDALTSNNEERIVIIKRGKAGISIKYKTSVINLPPPQVDSVTCDIGAGDILFGCVSMGYYLAKEQFSNIGESIIRAYNLAVPLLKLLLSSKSPNIFINRLITEDGYL